LQRFLGIREVGNAANLYLNHDDGSVFSAFAISTNN
jgi:hypothetical protein